jgi:hypothetical protein
MPTFAPGPVDQVPLGGQSFGGGGDMSSLFALFVVLAICLSIGGFILRMRYGTTYRPRRYWYRPWGMGPGVGGPMQPGPTWDPMLGNPAAQYGANAAMGPQVGPFPAPGCEPAPMGDGGFGSCDPGGMAAPPAGDMGGGTAGSIPS